MGNMSNIKKSDKIKEVIQTFARKTGNRTSEKFAIETIDTAIQKLERTYDFLKYVTIERTSHSEGMDSIRVNSEIDNVEMINLGKAVTDIFFLITKSILESENYFRVNLIEIKDDIEYECKSILNELRANLLVESDIIGAEGLSDAGAKDLTYKKRW